MNDSQKLGKKLTKEIEDILTINLAPFEFLLKVQKTSHQDPGSPSVPTLLTCVLASLGP